MRKYNKTYNKKDIDLEKFDVYVKELAQKKDVKINKHKIPGMIRLISYGNNILFLKEKYGENKKGKIEMHVLAQTKEEGENIANELEEKLLKD
jgi:hypothetical protein